MSDKLPVKGRDVRPRPPTPEDDNLQKGVNELYALLLAIAKANPTAIRFPKEGATAKSDLADVADVEGNREDM